MKRRLFITALAVFITALLSCSSVVPAFAGASVEGIPVINIEGINSDTLYENIGTPEERAVFVPSQEAILKASARLALPLSRVLIDRDFQRFGDTFIPVAYDIFDPISCNPDGTSKYNVGIKSDMTLPQGYQFDRTLTFNYDWRRDPMSVADDLKAYIDYVKRETGSKEIDLIPNSMGGVVAAAYLMKYGSVDIDTLILRSCAVQGVSLVGELFTQNVSVDEQVIKNFIRGMMKDEALADEINLGLDAAGVYGFSVGFVNELIRELKGRAYDEVLKKVYATMPGIWSLVPDKYYENAKAMMLDEQANAALIEKIDAYHYGVQCNLKKILDGVIESGTKLALTSNYGLQGIPLSPNIYAQTDYLIDTVYTSAGATCAPLGSDLGVDYIQAVADGHNHLSADRVIDASTCMYPEYTWFIKGMVHTQFNADYYEIIIWILNADTQPNVFSDARYPQFFILNKAENTLSPLTAPQPGATTLIQNLARLLDALQAAFVLR